MYKCHHFFFISQYMSCELKSCGKIMKFLQKQTHCHWEKRLMSQFSCTGAGFFRATACLQDFSFCSPIAYYVCSCIKEYFP